MKAIISVIIDLFEVKFSGELVIRFQEGRPFHVTKTETQQFDTESSEIKE